jgi:hypothetical protein
MSAGCICCIAELQGSHTGSSSGSSRALVGSRRLLQLPARQQGGLLSGLTAAVMPQAAQVRGLYTLLKRPCHKVIRVKLVPAAACSALNVVNLACNTVLAAWLAALGCLAQLKVLLCLVNRADMHNALHSERPLHTPQYTHPSALRPLSADAWQGRPATRQRCSCPPNWQHSRRPHRPSVWCWRQHQHWREPWHRCTWQPDDPSEHAGPAGSSSAHDGSRQKAAAVGQPRNPAHGQQHEGICGNFTGGRRCACCRQLHRMPNTMRVVKIVATLLQASAIRFVWLVCMAS